jgi:triacylglycerol lipase
MLTPTSVFLVPGFFGFAAIGEMRYFAHVRPALTQLLAERGVEAQVHEVATRPTASLRHRVELLAHEIVQRAPNRRVWVVGHSAGGLDGRILAGEAVDLGRAQTTLKHAQSQLEAVVTIASPHRGTPLASSFVGLSGQRALGILSASAVAVLRRGRLPLKATVDVLRVLRGLDAGKNVDGALLDQILDDVLRDLPAARRDEIAKFLQDVHLTQGLLPQLTPEAMDLVQLGVHSVASVRGASVLARASRPRVGTCGIWASTPPAKPCTPCSPGSTATPRAPVCSWRSCQRHMGLVSTASMGATTTGLSPPRPRPGER